MTDWTAPDLGIKADEFLTTLLGETRERAEETVILGRKLEDKVDPETGKEKRGGFIPFRWPESTTTRKHHASIGLQRITHDGMRDGQTSRNINWTGMWALVLDDVGEKATAPEIDPTCIIETKPGSQQWWFVFKEPVRNLFLAEQLIDGAIAAGLSDPGMSNVVRWARLPGSQPPGKKHAARVVEWNPDLRFEPEELAADLGLKLGAWDHWNGETAGFDAAGMGDAVDDPLLAWMVENGIVSAKSGREWFAIPCPCGDEHSNDDLNAYYFPLREQGGGMFKCFHGHGDKPPVHADFVAYLKDAGCPDEALQPVSRTGARVMTELAQLLGLVPPAPKEGQPMTALERRRLRLAQEERNEAAKASGMVPKDKEPAPEIDASDHSDFVFNRVTGRFMHKYEDTDCSVAAYDIEFETRMGVEINDAKKVVAPSVAFRRVGQVVSGTEYAPDKPDVFRDELTGKWLLNEYQRTPLPVATPGGAARCQPLEDLFMNALGEHGPLVLDFVAHVVQKPGIKIIWAPVLVGRGGTGKSTMLNVLRSALGKHAGLFDVAALQERKYLMKMTGKTFVAIHELKQDTGKGLVADRQSLTEALKPFITEDFVEVADKNVRSTERRNITNYGFATNHNDALLLSDDNSHRRFGVFSVEPTTTDWEALNALLEDGGAVRDWLLARDISRFNPAQEPPMTAAKRAMMDASTSGVSTMISDVIANGGRGIYEDMIAFPQLKSLSTALAEAMKEDPPRTAALKGELIRMGWRAIADNRRPKMAFGGERVSVRVFYRPEAMPAGWGDVEIATEIVRREKEADDRLTTSNVMQLKVSK